MAWHLAREADHITEPSDRALWLAWQTGVMTGWFADDPPGVQILHTLGVYVARSQRAELAEGCHSQ
ncbi:MAG: hypothetical protein C0478_12055 [Planctomyces sp.]|nr:hypothetical protein [Planctomyces sp.]